MNIRIHGAFETNNFGDLLLGWLCFKKLCNTNDIIIKGACQEMERLIKVKNSTDIKKCNGVIFFGGGYLGDSVSLKAMLHKIRVHYVPMFYCRICRIPYIIVGAGSRKFNNKLFIPFIRFCCNGAKEIIVRNYESKIDLTNIGIHKTCHVTADMALTFKPQYIPQEAQNTIKHFLLKQENKRLLLLHVTTKPCEDTKAGRQTIKIIKAVNEFITTNQEYTVVLCSDHYDKDAVLINSYVKTLLPLNQFIESKPFDVWELCALIQNSDVVITTKLHVGIVGCALNKSVLAIYSKDKVERFYNQINQNERCFHIDSIEVSYLVNKIKQFHNIPVTIPNNIHTLAQENYVYINNFIDSL